MNSVHIQKLVAQVSKASNGRHIAQSASLQTIIADNHRRAGHTTLSWLLRKYGKSTVWATILKVNFYIISESVSDVVEG